jgi:FixJ family two-component response regulator
MASHIPGTIVVIDDDPLVRNAIARLLRSMHCTVETFESVQAFLRSPRGEAPTCLVLAVDVPGLGDLELQQTLTAAPQPIPILFLTRGGPRRRAATALPGGAVAWLTKPFAAHELFNTLRQVITRPR